MKDRFEADVKPSPVIKESLSFGFTSCEKSKVLKSTIESISVAGHTNVGVCEIDMVFGFAVVTLPNPAIDLDTYISVRNTVVKIIKTMVEESENGS